ncbi:hypothetical protein EAPG_01328 [Escherichia albertii B156]|nr:hypothetical protein EAPG_01328 [Escherichia albertii B156]
MRIIIKTKQGKNLCCATIIFVAQS